MIERLGIRYLVVNRPGFGGSDPSPGRAVADHAWDLGKLMSVLGYGRFSVVGVSAGAPYALACGWAHGREDRLVPLAHALALAAAIPGCEARVDPAGGHFFYSRRVGDILRPLLPDVPAATTTSPTTMLRAA